MSTNPIRPPQGEPKRPAKELSQAPVTEVPLDGGGVLRIDSQGRVLCKARRRDGELCMQPVVAGLRVCRMHGAGAPNARLAARKALADLVQPSIRGLAAIIADDEGTEKTVDKLRAFFGVLDRTGYGPSQTVELGETREALRQTLLSIASDDGGEDETARQPQWDDDEEAD